jgi:hypothetical protein
MTNSGLLIAVAALAVTALAAFAVYRWRQRQRVRRVEQWVKDYLSVRYDGQPGRLSIDCSDDPLWPVLVAFDDPRTGAHHRLRFTCAGPASTFSLQAEQEELRQSR